MKRLFVIWNLCLFWILSFVICHSSFAQVVPSNILIEQAKEYDGKEIEFSGEVVGEPMKRGNFVWINVLDNFNAVGIWAEANQSKIIKFAGDYRYHGDTILVRGIFHRACPQHGGDLDIHAISIIKIQEGHRASHFLPRQKNEAMRTLLFLLLAVAVLILTGEKKKKKYGRSYF